MMRGRIAEWPERLRRQIMEYNILDFSKWKDEREFGNVPKADRWAGFVL